MICPNIGGFTGQIPMHPAVNEGYFSCLQLIISKFPEGIFQVEKASQKNLLSMIPENELSNVSYQEAITFLIKHGADISSLMEKDAGIMLTTQVNIALNKRDAKDRKYADLLKILAEEEKLLDSMKAPQKKEYSPTLFSGVLSAKDPIEIRQESIGIVMSHIYKLKASLYQEEVLKEPEEFIKEHKSFLKSMKLDKLVIDGIEQCTYENSRNNIVKVPAT